MNKTQKLSSSLSSVVGSSNKKELSSSQRGSTSSSSSRQQKSSGYSKEQSSKKNASSSSGQEDGEDISTSVKLDVYKTFEEMDLSDDLLRGIYQYGFTKPSAIQQRAIKPIIQGYDLIAQSQSGTGTLLSSC